MFCARLVGRGVVIALLACMILTESALPQTQYGPRMEPVADTRLLMEGLNLANFRGLERHLKQEPSGNDAWAFVRGQALLIAETGNLLMLRPPRNRGDSVWQERSVDLRSAATRLARAASNREYARCRNGMNEIATVCNRCHQSFRVPVRLTPFADPDEKSEVPTP